MRKFSLEAVLATSLGLVILITATPKPALFLSQQPAMALHLKRV